MNLKIFILSIFSLFIFTSVNNQTGDSKFKDTQSVLKSLYLYNFASLTDWPSNYKKGDFIIGVLSKDNKVYGELKKKYEDKRIGGQDIRIVNYANVGEIDKVNLLFLDKSQSSLINSVNEKIKSQSTLLVTNKTGYLNKGAIINFVEVNNKQSYEINVRNAKKKKLILASKLIELAIKKIE